MSENEREQPLPQRERGATRAGVTSASVPAGPQLLTDDVRQRIRAAVQAERAHGAGQAEERATESPRKPSALRRRPDRDAANAADQGGEGQDKRVGRSKRPARAKSAIKAARTAKTNRPVKSEEEVSPVSPVTSAVPADVEAPIHVVPMQPEPPRPVSHADDVSTDEFASVRPRPPGPETAGPGATEKAHPEPSQPAKPTAPRQSNPVRPPAAVSQKPAGAQAGKAARPALRPTGEGKRQGRRQLATVSLIALTVIVLICGAVAVAVVLRSPSSPSSGGTPGTVLERQEENIRNETAAWVVQHVEQNVPVACDPAMCSALRAAGFPPEELRVLGPTSSYPLKSAVVMETAAVRSLFGTSLSSLYAPAVLTTYGSGDLRISVRVIAPGGAAAYQRELAADRAARKESGAALLQARQITVSPLARQQLLAGLIDARLVIALANLAADQPIDIVQCGNVGRGASTDMPLRFADLATTDHAADRSSPAYLQTLRTQLSTGPGDHPASMMTGVLPGGQTILRVEFAAPSPLGLLGP